MTKNAFETISEEDKEKIDNLIDEMMQVASKYDVLFSVSLHSLKNKDEVLVATYPLADGLDRDADFFKVASNYLFAIKGLEFKNSFEDSEFLMTSLDARQFVKDMAPILKQMAANKNNDIKVH